MGVLDLIELVSSCAGVGIVVWVSLTSVWACTEAGTAVMCRTSVARLRCSGVVVVSWTVGVAVLAGAGIVVVVVMEGLSLHLVPLVRLTISRLRFVHAQGTVRIEFPSNFAPCKRVVRQFF